MIGSLSGWCTSILVCEGFHPSNRSIRLLLGSWHLWSQRPAAKNSRRGMDETSLEHEESGVGVRGPPHAVVPANSNLSDAASQTLQELDIISNQYLHKGNV